MSQRKITSRRCQIAKQNSQPHPLLDSSCPGSTHDWPDDGANPAASHQQTHSKHSRLPLVEPSAMNRKNPFAENRKQHPVGAHQSESSLDEDSGSQPRVFPNIADAFLDWREIREIARLQRRANLSMRLIELHAADQQRGEHKRERVQNEHEVPAEIGRHRTTYRESRSEERRVGKECRSRGSPHHY